MRAAVQAVLVPRRHPQPRRAGDARIDPRGRRAGIRAVPRVRRGVRQPGPGGRGCVVGDGEAETGPLAASWHSNKFSTPSRDGAVLPILHLNGYKIANPTVLARIPREELAALLRGLRPRPIFVEGDDPPTCTARWRRPRRGARRDPRDPARRAARRASDERPPWPMIVLRTPKGWTGPEAVDGKQVEGTWRAHQVPLAKCASNPATSAELEAGCGPTAPRSSSTSPDAARRRAGAGARGRAADERQPARQRRPAAAGPAPARLPRLRGRGAVAGAGTSEATRVLGGFLRDVMKANPTTSASSAPTRPRPTGSARSRGHRPAGLAGRDPRRPTSTWRRTAGSWRS